MRDITAFQQPVNVITVGGQWYLNTFTLAIRANVKGVQINYLFVRKRLV